MHGKKLTAFDYLNGTGMILLSLATLYPLWYVLINSFLNYEDSMRSVSLLWPSSFTMTSYRTIFQDSMLVNGFLLSVLRTASATTVHVVFTSMVAYALSKSFLIGRKFHIRFGLVTMLFSGGLIPTFVLYYRIGLYDNFLVYVLPAMFSYYNMLIFRTFFRQMPASMEESATIDGAGTLRTFFSVVMPNAKAVTATIALYAIVYHWNDFFIGYIFVRNSALKPLQTVLYRIINENVGNQMQKQVMSAMGYKVSANSIKYAAMMTATVPVLAVYPFLQKYLVKGVMLGAIKE